MCSFHDNLVSIIIPRNLKLVTVSICILSINIKDMSFSVHDVLCVYIQESL